MSQRERILNYLYTHPSVTVAELGRMLQMSAAAVRHHLRALERAGLLEGENMPGGRKGRPQRRYRLVPGLRGDNLARLSELLFAILQEQGWERKALAEALSKGLLRACAAAEPEVPERLRLQLTMEFLRRLQYLPRWEAAAQGPRLFFQHCPYEAILESHPELCEMDVLLLEGCLKKRVTLLMRGDWKEGHATACIFQVQG
ncbi:MAG: helix-turn-helix transcriptional regulator [Anaerolineales bacterium]